MDPSRSLLDLNLLVLPAFSFVDGRQQKHASRTRLLRQLEDARCDATTRGPSGHGTGGHHHTRARFWQPTLAPKSDQLNPGVGSYGCEEEMTKGEGPLIGIDLGTTYSYAGMWQQVEIMANDQGNHTTPSYIA
ncbi:hypothetical protein CFC21_074770 [Triticum aestivum]|uniref:Uncharacterized protein n=2 Tax=Triticum aestivum TaxID=4565 RepID=A0A9R1HPV1_WHEAT|nr:hypothetical protein CFC21_074770 [Triticum aestivum]